MRRGCVSLGEVQCDSCHRFIPFADRYLAITEEGGVEAETGNTAYYCTECALEKGYASYKKEDKEGRILTFLP
ncbi:MAG: hypothetical protein Q8Q07_00200 [Dehalococcoidales bacterium]|nr:hypothetical protein [Dehalococcoidales bacterium]